MTSRKNARAARMRERVSRIRARHVTALQAAGSTLERLSEAVRYLRSAVATVKAADPAILSAAARTVSKCADELLDLAQDRPRP